MHDEQRTALATEFAEALGEPDKLPLYVSFTHLLSEEKLREIFAKVMSFPDHMIRTTRAQYFNHLVQQHAGKHRPRA